MSEQPPIAVENVSKFFEVYDRPAHRLWQMLCRGRRNFYRPFWALRDVSFTVERGECIGIIGRNGAGKSTLLQIIAGTLPPSSGQARVNGRVAALLELGSGFNPEFTGRENVRLNAAILGLSDREIRERFDAIAEFADIGDFIDQPVKSYSSGMILRLAFAVVAHVDAEVLIVDEALAVGDAFFTQKCMRFLRNFMKEHTVLFVSHDAGAVRSLCNRAILLEHGRVKQIGSPKDVTETYLRDMVEANQGVSREAEKTASPGKETGASNGAAETRPEKDVDSPTAYRDMRADFINSSPLRNDIQVFAFNEESASFGKGGATIADAKLLDGEGRPLAWIVGGEPVTLAITIDVHQEMASPIVGFSLKNRFGQNIFGDNTYLSFRDNPPTFRAGDRAEARFSFIMPILERGDYSMSVAVADGTQDAHVQHDWKHDALLFKSVTTSLHTGLVGIPMKNISLERI